MLVHGRYKKFGGKATFFYLFEAGADNVDDIDLPSPRVASVKHSLQY
jgi:hypothetical protein